MPPPNYPVLFARANSVISMSRLGAPRHHLRKGFFQKPASLLRGDFGNKPTKEHTLQKVIPKDASLIGALQESCRAVFMFDHAQCIIETERGGFIMRRDIRRNDRSSHANIAKCGILAIGLGSLAAYQLMLFFNVTAYVASLSGPESALDRSYLIQGLALFASYLLAARFPEQTRRLTQRQSSKLLAALLLAAATIALSFAGMSETTATVLFPLGGIVAGVASAALFLAYSQAFCMLSLRQNLITSTLAFGLTSIFFALFSSPERTGACFRRFDDRGERGCHLAVKLTLEETCRTGTAQQRSRLGAGLDRSVHPAHHRMGNH